MWMTASSASVAANSKIITINGNESMSNVVAGDAAILDNLPPVEIASAQVNGTWQLSLQEPWPYQTLNKVALRVQPNGGRFENAIDAMRRTNTTANNILAGMREWLTSTNKTVTVTDASGTEYKVPTLANWGTAAQRNIGNETGDVMEVGEFGIGSTIKVLGNLKRENDSDVNWVKLFTLNGGNVGWKAPATVMFTSRHHETMTYSRLGFLLIGGSSQSSGIVFRPLTPSALGHSELFDFYTRPATDGTNRTEVFAKFSNPYLRASFVLLNSSSEDMDTITWAGDAPLTQDGGLKFLTSEPEGLIPFSSYKGVNSHNATVDSNGFIKSASPIIKLYANKIDTNDLVAKAQLVKNSVGSYTISGTHGFAKEGWYIETPKDANGNIKVFVEYEQVDDENGAPLLNVRTFIPEYGAGPVQPGKAVDIPSGRFITLRCAEDTDS